MGDVLGIFRFGRQPHIEEFSKLGRLYMKPISYFRELERDHLRGDPVEGTTWTMPSSKAELQVEVHGEFQTIPGITGAVRFSSDRDSTLNVFCMYALRLKHRETLIDPRNFTFGDTYATLLDADEFLRRVQRASIPPGQQLQYRLVEYVSPTEYLGPMGAFRKFANFEYQSEFRIAVVPGTGGDFGLDVGDLSDLVLTGELQGVNNRIRVVESAG